MTDTNVERLAALVCDQIATAPVERDGYVWAARPLAWYASELKVSTKKVAQWTKSPEFDRLDILIDGKKTSLLRLKKPGDLMTATHCQRVLKKMFLEALPPFNEKKAKFHEESLTALEGNLALFEKEKALYEKLDQGNKKALKAKTLEIECTQNEIKRQSKKLQKARESAKKAFTVSPKTYGCLRGLVDAWGVQDAPELLQLVMNDWSSFMVGTKVFIAGIEEGTPLYYRFFEYPTIRYILLFNHVALELAIMEMQAKVTDIGSAKYKRIVAARTKQLTCLKEHLGIAE